MSYKDEMFGEVFPTRTGPSIGSANERLMLDAIGGSESFRTRIMETQEGETLLRTKNGMPQFSTLRNQSAPEDDKPKRTFVFSSQATPGVARIANRSGAGFKVVAMEYSTISRPVYGVMPTKSDRSGNLWNDVLRLEGGTKLNARTELPTVSQVGETKNYGIPYLLPSESEGGDVSRICVGIADGVSTRGPVPTLLLGVASIAKSGAILSFTRAPGQSPSSQHKVSGIRCTPAGEFHFLWQVDNFTGYAKIIVSDRSMPMLEDFGGSTLTLDPIQFLSVNYSTSSSQTVVEAGWWFNALEWEIVGSMFIGCIEYYTVMAHLIARRTIYAVVANSIWSKSITFSDTKTLGGGANAVVISRSVSGSETMTEKKAGQRSLEDPTVAYTSPNGSESNWSNTTSSTVSALHGLSGKDLYRSVVTTTSTLQTGQFRVPYEHFDYSQQAGYGVPAPSGYSVGGVNAQGVVDAVNRSNQANLAHDASQHSMVQKWNLPAIIDWPESNPQDRRYDEITLSLSSCDWVFFDPDEQVSLALVCSVKYSGTKETIPSPSIMVFPDYFPDGVCSMEIKYVLDVRGSIIEFPVYANSNCWPPYISYGPAGAFEQPDTWENTYSGIHVPGNPSLTFAIPFMAQGNCPFIGYTTLAEEASGATPEFYIDIKIDAQPEIDPSTYSLDANPFHFSANNLGKLFTNYMGFNAPEDVWDGVVFKSPPRILYAIGIAGLWPEKLGAPFSSDSIVTITRI